MTVPLTEEYLSDIMALNALRANKGTIRVPHGEDVQGVKAILTLANEVPSLVAEIRRLQKQYADQWKAGAAEDRRTARIEADLLAMTVERDNLRKMLEDEKAARLSERKEWQASVASAVDGRVIFAGLDVSHGLFDDRGRLMGKPQPMCKDPLVDLFPAGGEGSPT